VDSNPLIQPGDIVSLPDAAQVYVVGNVFRPTSIPLKDQPVTLATAIAVAGGALPDSKKSKVRLTRQQPGNAAKQEIIVDLEAITKRQADDIVLQANDIVEVPTSSGKRLLRSLLGTIAPAVSQLPVRVIP
jgi:polysaccharide export outer membrane protein